MIWFVYAQIEFETAKYEIRRLSEEIELLNSKCEELGKLKQIAEKQMEEALEALQVRGEEQIVFYFRKLIRFWLNPLSTLSSQSFPFESLSGVLVTFWGCLLSTLD